MQQMHDEPQPKPPPRQPPLCRGKIVYRTYEHAANDAKRVRRKRDQRIEPYYCRSCGGFHVGRKRGLRPGQVQHLKKVKRGEEA